MSAWVYILQTETNRYYIGSTDNLDRRLKQHREGHTPSTKRLKVEKILFTQKYDNLPQARTVENKLKKLKRRDYIENIIKDGYIKIRP